MIPSHIQPLHILPNPHLSSNAPKDRLRSCVSHISHFYSTTGWFDQYTPIFLHTGTQTRKYQSRQNEKKQKTIYRMCPRGPFSLNAHQPPYSCMSHFISLGICFMTQLALRTACLTAPSKRDTGVENATSKGLQCFHDCLSSTHDGHGNSVPARYWKSMRFDDYHEGFLM